MTAGETTKYGRATPAGDYRLFRLGDPLAIDMDLGHPAFCGKLCDRSNSFFCGLLWWHPIKSRGICHDFFSVRTDAHPHNLQRGVNTLDLDDSLFTTMLQQPRHQLHKITRTRPVVQLMGEQLIPRGRTSA